MSELDDYCVSRRPRMLDDEALYNAIGFVSLAVKMSESPTTRIAWQEIVDHLAAIQRSVALLTGSTGGHTHSA